MLSLADGEVGPKLSNIVSTLMTFARTPLTQIKPPSRILV
jgi:hypothetical protein